MATYATIGFFPDRLTDDDLAQSLRISIFLHGEVPALGRWTHEVFRAELERRRDGGCQGDEGSPPPVIKFGGWTNEDLSRAMFFVHAGLDHCQVERFRELLADLMKPMLCELSRRLGVDLSSREPYRPN